MARTRSINTVTGAASKPTPEPLASWDFDLNRWFLLAFAVAVQGPACLLGCGEVGGFEVGLGLAVIDRVVRHHHGTVTIGEAPLGGARFTVVLAAAS